MARTFTSRVNLPSYDDMVKPLVAYKEAYDKVAENVSAMDMDTNMLLSSIDPSTKAYQQVAQYRDQLREYSDDFSRGMTYKNSAGLMGMKRGFARDIVPIKQAQENYNKFREDRFKLGPGVIFKQNSYSVDDFMNGNSPNNEYEDRNYLTTRAANLTRAAYAELMKDPDIERDMGAQYWKLTQHTGGSYEELQAALKEAILENPIIGNKFSEIRHRLAKEMKLDEYDAEGQAKAIEAIDTGISMGLDDPKISYQANRGYGMNFGSNGRGKGNTPEYTFLDKKRGIITDGKQIYTVDKDGDKIIYNGPDRKQLEKLVKFNGKGDSNSGSYGPTLADNQVIIIKNPATLLKGNRKYGKGSQHTVSKERAAQMLEEMGIKENETPIDVTLEDIENWRYNTKDTQDDYNALLEQLFSKYSRDYLNTLHISKYADGTIVLLPGGKPFKGSGTSTNGSIEGPSNKDDIQTLDSDALGSYLN